MVRGMCRLSSCRLTAVKTKRGQKKFFFVMKKIFSYRQSDSAKQRCLGRSNSGVQRKMVLDCVRVKFQEGGRGRGGCFSSLAFPMGIFNLNLPSQSISFFGKVHQIAEPSQAVYK